MKSRQTWAEAMIDPLANIIQLLRAVCYNKYKYYIWIFYINLNFFQTLSFEKIFFFTSVNILNGRRISAYLDRIKWASIDSQTGSEVSNQPVA
jgi:hypothetical protein